MEDEGFRSVNSYTGKITPTELDRLDTALQELVRTPGWSMLCRLLRIEREQHVRQMATRVLEHAEYAHTGGLVKALVAPETIVANVHGKATAMRAAGGLEDAETGTEGTG